MSRPHPTTGTSRRSGPAMLAWAAVLGGMLIVAVGTAGAQTEPTEGLVERGAELYAVHCAQCHGADGGGVIIPGMNVEAPPLSGPDGVSVAYVDLVLRTGRMPPGGNPFDNQARSDVINEEGRQALVAYTREAFDLEGDIPDVGEGDPARGQQIYGIHCAACHGATGDGGVAGGGAWTPAVNQYEAPAIAEAVRIGPFEMPAFDESQVSEEEVADVAAFLRFVGEEEGTLLGLVELNPVFISGFVAVMALVLILSLLYISGTPAWFPDPEAAQEEQATDPSSEDAS